jgi:hypothetical protein
MINNSYVVNIDTSTNTDINIDAKLDEHDLFSDGNYVINPLIKQKRSPYVYDENVEKLSEMFPECYVCFEKTILYSPCLCKAPLCYTCFLEITKKVDSKKCTICKHPFIENYRNNYYNPLYFDNRIVETNNNIYSCWNKNFFIKLFFYTLYIVITSFIFGNIFVKNVIFDDEKNEPNKIRFDFLTFSIGIMFSSLSILILFLIYLIFNETIKQLRRNCIHCIQECRLLLFY